MNRAAPTLIRGKVQDGLGEGALFTKLDWVTDQCLQFLGFRPYPGTLNLEVLPDDVAIWNSLAPEKGITLRAPDPSFCDGLCWRLLLPDGIQAAAVVPLVAGYPSSKMEILAPVSLRTELSLSAGDLLTVEVVD